MICLDKNEVICLLADDLVPFFRVHSVLDFGHTFDERKEMRGAK